MGELVEDSLPKFIVQRTHITDPDTMSFFTKHGSGSDTDSDSGSDSEESILSGDEGLEQDRKIAAAQKPKNKASMFLKSDDEGEDESSEEEESDDEDDSDEEGGKAVSRVPGTYVWSSWKGLMEVLKGA